MSCTGAFNVLGRSFRAAGLKGVFPFPMGNGATLPLPVPGEGIFPPPLPAPGEVTLPPPLPPPGVGGLGVVGEVRVEDEEEEEKGEMEPRLVGEITPASLRKIRSLRLRFHSSKASTADVVFAGFFSSGC